MKIFRLFLILAVTALLGVGFVSCDKNDSSETFDGNQLVGTWEGIWMTGYNIDSENPEDNEEWDGPILEPTVIKFAADGSGSDVDGEPFKWTLQGDILRIDYEDSGEEPEISKILSLTDTQLIFEVYEKDATSEYYSKISFRKVK